MNAAYDMAQLGQGRLGLVLRLLQQPSRGRRVGVVRPTGQAQPHGERHQVRLRPVVQVPLDPAQFRAVGGDRSRPSEGELLDPVGRTGIRGGLQEQV